MLLSLNDFEDLFRTVYFHVFIAWIAGLCLKFRLAHICDLIASEHFRKVRERLLFMISQWILKLEIVRIVESSSFSMSFCFFYKLDRYALWKFSLFARNQFARSLFWNRCQTKSLSLSITLWNDIFKSAKVRDWPTILYFLDYLTIFSMLSF